MAQRFDVCVFGSANLDLVATTARHPRPGETVLGSDYSEHPGGKGLNQAVSAARSGAATAFVGAVGCDGAGDRLRAVLSDEGIDDRSLATSDAPTGRALITVDEAGENSIVVVPGANATMDSDVELPPAAVVLAQLEVPVDAVVSALTAASRDGSQVVLNPAPAAPLPPTLIASCDVVVPNQHELELLGGVEQVLGHGCSAVVVTLGADGADVHTDSGTTHVASYDVQVVDTTGAGDAFCGALACRLAAGDDLLAAVRWATAAGALATTVHGAVPAQPSARQITALMAG